MGNSSTPDPRLPPQVLGFKHRVLVAVERGHLDVLIVIRQQPVFLPLRLLQPEMRFVLISGSLRPGDTESAGERGPLGAKGQSEQNQRC